MVWQHADGRTAGIAGLQTQAASRPWSALPAMRAQRRAPEITSLEL